MQSSEKFGFYLPSRDSDDIADINQISENFRIIDENIPSKDELKNEIEKEKIIVDQIYNSKSKNAQSGIAVKEAVESSHKTYYGTEINYDGELGTGSNYNCGKMSQLNTANKGDYFVNTDTGAVYNITEVWKENNSYATVFYKIIVKPSVTVDQSYTPTSNNPQSGKAVAEAIDKSIGDISAALDELHAYAQSLVNGGAN